MPRGIPKTPRSAAPLRSSAPESSRPTRADTVRQERRKKPGQVAHSGIKLSLDEEKADRKTYHYRFVNDSGGRVQRLTADDYDVVSEPIKEDANGVGSVVQTHGGFADGKPFNMVLMRKRRDWFEQDQKDKEKPLDEMDEAIRRGKDHAAQGSNLALKGEGVYTPGTNEINQI